MRTHRIALYPGDGIGPEVTDAAVAVLSAARDKRRSFDLSFERFDWGMPYYDRHGAVAPDDFVSTLRSFDAVFLGAVGWPARLPDHITLAPLIRLRQAFDLYACVRPARTFAGVRGPLRSESTSTTGERSRSIRRTRWHSRPLCIHGAASSGSFVSRSSLRGHAAGAWP
jgi:tartrate dehydrogenase/decarboxylase / D-malate dehydrogenase